MKVRLKQLAQDGATDGQGLVYNAASGLWLPGTVGGGGGATQETEVLDRTRSVFGSTWTVATTLTISTAGIYELDLTGTVTASSTTVGSAQLRLLRDGVPLSGYGFERDADGVFYDALPSIAWGPAPFTVRLRIYSDGTDTFTLQFRNADASNYCAVGSPKIQAFRRSDLDTVDAISTRIMRLHADRANYAWVDATAPVDWWSDAFTGYRWLDADGINTHGGGEFTPDGWAAGVDTIQIPNSSGGFVGNIPAHASTDHTFLFIIHPSVNTGDFVNLLRHTAVGSELGFLQSHAGGGASELGYLYGHSGSVQKLGVAGTLVQQSLGVVFDKTGSDEVRVYRNGVEIASASLVGQTGQTFSTVNQGWFSFPTSQGFACACEIREVFAFSNALDTVTLDWDAFNDYVAAQYSLDDRP